MAGKRAKNSSPNRRAKCPLCGGRLGRGKATLPFVQKERVVVVKGVPSDVCGDCGEASLSGRTLDRIEELMEKLLRLDAEVSLIHYKAA